MIRILLSGCNGRMGQVISSMVSEDPQMKIAAGIDITQAPSAAYPVFGSLKECDVKGDVLIDFSSPKAFDGLLDSCIEKRIPAVICTTGLDPHQIERLEAASSSIAVLRSANMSLGINLLQKLLKDAVSVLMPAGFDVEIVEKHHKHKKDAPSGTAIALADSVNEAAGGQMTYVYDRSGRYEERQASELGISSVRGGSIVGDHDVIFAGTDEVITLSHVAYSRAIFAKGAVTAARYLAGKAPGFYTMSDVIRNA